MADPPTVSVVVPTYRRTDVLPGCLRALHAQNLQPLEVLVCRRETDHETRDALAALSADERRLVREIVLGPDDNFRVALDTGIRSSRGDLVALTDDDAEAPADWLERMAASFLDESVAGAGGRDVIVGEPPSATDVGRVQWFGRIIGNHHIGMGPPREVDVVKGVNCCFRGDLARSVGVDPRLRGAGTVTHTELSLCLPLRRAGYRFIYDPQTVLTHHVAPRGDGDANNRGGFNARSLTCLVHNETVALLDHLSVPGKAAFVAWAGLVGTRFNPGLVQAARLLLTDSPGRVASRWFATVKGRLDGAKTWMFQRRPLKRLAPPHAQGGGV